ncbi:MAG: sodium-translocating pyrophosphatase [Clostridia bacterium]|nr:sodium-translocating pyrophosphatase [Clostridia bacterium]
MTLFLIVLMVASLGLVYSIFNLVKVKSFDEGTAEMAEIAAAIREGSNTFLMREYKVLIIVVIIVAIIFGIFIEQSSAIAFLIGTVMSGLGGFIGMKSSTYSNVRVANEARKTKNIGKTLKVALRGGSVMGLGIGGFGLMGLAIVFIIFNGQLDNLGSVTNWCGIEFEPFSMTISSYALGCSIIAMFNRVGGGIYTKAADMGADLVGKTEENIPEDDPRNPAVIADCVGDNVGDTAGLGSDLLESYIGAIVSSIVLIIYFFKRYTALGMEFSQDLLKKLYMYPIWFACIGLISCIIGLAYIFLKKDGSNPHKELNKATWLSAGLTAILNAVMTQLWIGGESFGDLPFMFGAWSLFISAVIGIISGIIIGAIAEYYTSYDYEPTKKIAEFSKEGPAITITQGMSVGMKSTLLSVLVLGIALMISHFCGGEFGVAMAAVGMLSFVTVTVSVDTYGPISDNAGGIAEMSNLGEDVRNITDKLDAVGNTTAAIGKGFAIGSAAFAAVSLMISYLYAFSPIDSDVTLDLMNPKILAGALIGSAIAYYFSGLLIEAVANSAKKMVDEVRRQFREVVGLKEGKVKPDYKKCIDIATKGALAEMKLPALIAILVPVASGFVIGPEFVSGILIGSTISSIMLAIYTGNVGGAWDNSKKFIESLGKKGTDQHYAAVVGDTVGDPLKDTVGPSLDILIKIMSTVSLIMVSIFSKYNLFEFITTFFK